MNYIWCGKREEVNSQKIFKITNQNCVKMIVCAVDNYQIFLDGEFVCYGPERTASQYVRRREINIAGAKDIEIKVISHNFPIYMCDQQLPFFGADLYDNNDKVILTSEDFSCYYDEARAIDLPRYSFQRGFVEKIDYSKTRYVEQSKYYVDAPTELEGLGDTCQYQTIPFRKTEEDIIDLFDNIQNLWWEKADKSTKTKDFDIQKDFIEKVKERQYKIVEYCLPVEKTGFIKLQFKAKTKVDIFVTFEEIKQDGKWEFRRSQCNDFLEVCSNEGENKFISSEPYTMKYLRIAYFGELEIEPSIILYQNDLPFNVDKFEDYKIQTICDAAVNTFRQNAVDIFTDCPGRERAGYLCDSYFSGQTEYLLTGKNEIERNFLENFIISRTPELPEHMLPMCFPSEHDNLYIPNWAMWFVLELQEYYKRTNDRAMVDLAKDKVDGLLLYFSQYENRFGLLENLSGWVFIEWSIANSIDYKKGVNFPSNMLYSAMLDAISELYGYAHLKAKSENIKKLINLYSFNGEYYVDNAVVEATKIIPFKDHISETCQYYALYFGINTSDEYKQKVLVNLGPKMNEEETKIGKSNMFIGNYLRLFWLLREKQYEKIKEESIDYFYEMARETGTLWENNSPSASCNHGFASVVLVLLNQIYNTTKNLQ